MVVYRNHKKPVFHVPMWFGMMILFIVSVVYAVIYLNKPNSKADIYSVEFARTGTVSALLVLLQVQSGLTINGEHSGVAILNRTVL
jgi:hypothetical protein